jgi:amino-acid N-acetyltransferase
VRDLDFSLPAGCILRRARTNDMRSIWKLVLSAKLDPTQLSTIHPYNFGRVVSAR